MVEQVIETLSEARKFLVRRQASIGVKHSRTHHEGSEITALKLKVLNQEPCCQCEHLRAIIGNRPPHHQISLKCTVFYDPVELYRAVGLGEHPTCPKFTPRLR